MYVTRANRVLLYNRETKHPITDCCNNNKYHLLLYGLVVSSLILFPYYVVEYSSCTVVGTRQSVTTSQ